MSIPTDPMFGRPIGGPPITSWGARRDAPRRARSLVAIPERYRRGERELIPLVDVGGAAAMVWDPHRAMTIDGEIRAVTLVRSLRKAWDPADDLPTDNPSVLWAVPLPLPAIPGGLNPDAAQLLRRDHMPMARPLKRVRREIAILPGEAQWLERSPWTMSLAECSAAASRGLTTAHLYRGVREEHGRWQGYVGLGGMLRIVATCDTRSEALALATAVLYRDWLAEVESIREARGGDLSWGWPIGTPVLEDEDPQARW